ncbi:uncharacterized protein LOC144713457 [Wolffia australiana]
MEGTTTTKMGRSPSSLLRSPTLRSIQSLPLLDEEDPTAEIREPDEEKKKRGRRIAHRCPSFSAMTAAPTFSLLLFLSAFLLFYHLREESPFLGNLALASAAMAMASLALKRVRLICNPGRPIRDGSAVEWFIGEGKEEKAGELAKEGVEVYTNGDYYEGEFNLGKSNGSGVYYYVGNGKYEGDWVEGKYDGHGVESWSRGSRYRGQYRRGLRHGAGVYRFYAGDCYAGEWVSGQSHGLGVQTCSDGSSYFGQFNRGVKHGLGSYHFRNGDRYAGEYFGDKIHGFGVYEFANGHRYEGSWHEGRKQGLGAYTFRTGEVKSGHWDNGVLKLALPAAQAVQAARDAAERAATLLRVDERVGRAVASANRAATAARVAAIKAVQNRMDGRFCHPGR